MGYQLLGYRKRLIHILWILGVALLCLLQPTFAATPQGTYTNWYWEPPDTGYRSLVHSLKIEAVTPDAPYFWSHQFQLVNGDVGYIGLQSNGNRVDGTVGKTAVFSVFKSGIAASPKVSPKLCEVKQNGFDGYDIAGSSCRTAYEWTIGHKYTMWTKISQVENDGTWWDGLIKDENTGLVTFLGRIKVPPTWRGMGAWSVMWTEYFGEKPKVCTELSYSRVRFYKPTANRGTVQPSRTSNEFSKPVDCTNSRITNTKNGTIQEMGNPANESIRNW